ncbi:glycosyltransferase family 2 protein [Nocardioides zeae]|uniref:Glycosyltransferase family 2 protein n=1 Tax=Nocardioides imazamoxiresistens TaxID=3231893 RepID=A0ABU3PVB7_9ACTN|nr:glycosyltransferase family 2 protein [Nocardioides zeae]MDT9593182.1 glycosyltransferase family 2 protein [Nocardioides zeae]
MSIDTDTRRADEGGPGRQAYAEARLRQHLAVLVGEEAPEPRPDHAPRWLDHVPGIPWRRAGMDLVAVIEPVWITPGTSSARLHAARSVLEQVRERLEVHLLDGESVEATDDGLLVLRLHHTGHGARPVRVQDMAYHTQAALARLGTVERLELGVGWAPITSRTDAERARRMAADGAAHSVRERDFQPVRRHPDAREAVISRGTFVAQILIASVGAFVVPLALLFLAYGLGLDISGVVYWVVVGALTITATAIWAECFASLDPTPPPPLPEGPEGEPPPATAIIAAYLPNEAETILDTIDSFLEQEYAGRLQVIVAYNTPTDLPVERELAVLAAQHPNLVALRVDDSTSKAQNVNAALRIATGHFVGIFDADHHPMPGAFARAWHWIADGVDVVQGHCVIRDADTLLSQLVAVEFEQLYAVAHPGRTILHTFGIFGGSNGYWRRDTLEKLRLRGSYLTEDIESSMRLLLDDGRIVNDPGLVSRELAPATVTGWWRQRLRWAQGWFQVSLRHLWPLMVKKGMGFRRRLGVAFLLAWRELYPWLVQLVWPLMVFLAWRDQGLDLLSPIFAFLTLYIVSSGAVQTLVAWRVAVPEIRRQRTWFVRYAIANVFFYTGAKNLVNRVAHLKQVRGERQWVVTARSASAPVHVATDLDTGATR